MPVVPVMLTDVPCRNGDDGVLHRMRRSLGRPWWCMQIWKSRRLNFE
ncbi:MAG: hypothetical protein ACLR0U_29250 [Enterocloster clostridioformis]